MPDVWASGEGYEAYVGRWSRPVAAEFLAWLAVPTGRRWVDVGCGTGALSQAVVDHCQPTHVLGVDPSDGFLEAARQRVTDPRAEFRSGDGTNLPAPDGAADAVVSALALNFFPDPVAGLVEMRRVAAPGGTVAAYVWDYSGGMQFIHRFWEAATALDPAAAELDEARRFPLTREDPLRQAFVDAGLADVEVRAIVVPTTFVDFDDFWTPFLGGQGPAPSYLSSLAETDRDAIRDRLRASLPTAGDVPIPLTARAWAARGAVA